MACIFGASSAATNPSSNPSTPEGCCNAAKITQIFLELFYISAVVVTVAVFLINNPNNSTLILTVSSGVCALSLIGYIISCVKSSGQKEATPSVAVAAPAAEPELLTGTAHPTPNSTLEKPPKKPPEEIEYRRWLKGQNPFGP